MVPRSVAQFSSPVVLREVNDVLWRMFGSGFVERVPSHPPPSPSFLINCLRGEQFIIMSSVRT